MHRIIQYFFKILYSPFWLLAILVWCLHRGKEIANGEKRSIHLSIDLDNLLEFWKYTKEN